VQNRIREIAADVFGVSAADLPEDASNENVPGWDSLHHLELMLALEMEFSVQISSEAMPALLSIDAIEEYLREQGVPASA
jgi:acyl carrier protein